MPYRLKGTEVQVKRGKRWKTVKKHKTARAAKAHLAALKINVREG